MRMESLKKAGLAALAGLGTLAVTAGGAYAATKDPLNSGDTAWMITSSALVLMMTIPGLGLFYAGMVRKKNVLATLAQSFGANEPGCLNCHGDKRGPFTFEHAPVRFEGCSTCHEAHGSANPRMLVRREVRFVCLECHENHRS